MSLASFLLMSAFLLAAGIQYGLAIFAIRDLGRRERLRGANKITWALIVLCIPFLGPLLYAMLATDGLPNPRPAPSATWPGRRWRGVRKVAQAGEQLIRGAEVPRESDPWDELPVSHEPVMRGERPNRDARSS